MEHLLIDVSGSGAVAEGTSRGSEGARILKEQGWRWARTLNAPCLPRSMTDPTVRRYIQDTCRALDAAGITYEVTGWDERESDEERWARRIERDRELAHVHAARASKLTAEADRRAAASDEMREHFPLGQPVLVGHYSEARHRRYRERMHNNMAKSVEARKAAHVEEHRSKEAAARAALAERRNDPPAFGPDDVVKGAVVETRFGDHRVIRVNQKTVTVPSISGGSGVDRIEYHKIIAVRNP